VKIFETNNINIARACQDHFSFEPLSLLSAKHVAKFCFVIGKHYL